MPTLLEVQHAICAFIASGNTAAGDFVIADGVAPHERLSIYRNTFIGNLVGALRISYPAVRRLVGDEFFEGAACVFIDDHPPQSAYLNAYGGKFAEFLAQFPPAASLVYLPDVARLEWAVNIALHAEDAPPLDIESLSVLSESEGFIFVAHPSVLLLELGHPADLIWRAVIDENDDALAAIDLSESPIYLIVSRSADGVSVERLSEPGWQFSADLLSGGSLSCALETAGTDMSSTLAAHLSAGRFTNVRPYGPDSKERKDL